MIKEKVHIISIPPDKQAELKIGGLFYQRLNKFLIEYSDSVKKDQLIAAINLIKAGKAQTNSFAFNLETLMILIRDTETAFKESGGVIEKDIDIEVPDDYKKSV